MHEVGYVRSNLPVLMHVGSKKNLNQRLFSLKKTRLIQTKYLRNNLKKINNNFYFKQCRKASKTLAFFFLF